MSLKMNLIQTSTMIITIGDNKMCNDRLLEYRNTVRFYIHYNEKLEVIYGMIRSWNSANRITVDEANNLILYAQHEYDNWIKENKQ